MSPDTAELPSSHLSQYVGKTTHQFEIAVVNTSYPESVSRMLQKLFERQPTDVVEGKVPEEETDCVLLLRDGEVVATSPLEELTSTILLVNSDLYITGSVELGDIQLPDVIADLSGTTFHVRGYPESHHEKMPLILISRYIERLSYANGGTHRASFQRLSRIDDEKGTRNVYARLSSAGVNTHVYGVPDWLPRREAGLKIHGGYGSDFDSTWFVIHRSKEEAAALVALEVAPNEWKGCWTFDDDTVADIEETVKTYL